MRIRVGCLTEQAGISIIQFCQFLMFVLLLQVLGGDANANALETLLSTLQKEPDKQLPQM